MYFQADPTVSWLQCRMKPERRLLYLTTRGAALMLLKMAGQPVDLQVKFVMSPLSVLLFGMIDKFG